MTRGSGFGRTGHASALVSSASSPASWRAPAFGLLVASAGGWTAGWALVTAAFAVAAVLSWAAAARCAAASDRTPGPGSGAGPGPGSGAGLRHAGGPGAGPGPVARRPCGRSQDMKS
ncbi:hypothetical protein ACFQ60_38005 [Streptomyces zhihengii]